MIIYESRKNTFGVLGHFTGSALFHWASLPMALLSGLIAGVCSEVPFFSNYLVQTVVNESAYFGGLSFIVGFVVVYRAQLSIQRYNNAQRAYFTMGSKIADIAMFICVWVDRSIDPFKSKKDLKQAQSNDDLVCSLVRWLQLYHELGTEEIQGFEFSSRYPRTCVTVTEAQMLSKVSKRPVIVMGWVLDAIAKNKSCFACSDPLLTRTYQLASEANALFNETRRISETPFPFPFAQITVMMITFWAIVTPMVIAPFFSGTYVGGVLISFFGTWMLFGVNEAATQLEQPFDDADNDLPILYYALSFQEEMSSLLNLSFPPIRESAKFSNRSADKTADVVYQTVNANSKFSHVGDFGVSDAFERTFKSYNKTKQSSGSSSASSGDERKKVGNHSALYSLFNLKNPFLGDEREDSEENEGVKKKEVEPQKTGVLNDLESQLEGELKNDFKQEIKPEDFKQEIKPQVKTLRKELSLKDFSNVKREEKKPRLRSSSLPKFVVRKVPDEKFIEKDVIKVCRTGSHSVLTFNCAQEAKNALSREHCQPEISRSRGESEVELEHSERKKFMMSNTLNGASGKKMLDAFENEVKHHWRDLGASTRAESKQITRLKQEPKNPSEEKSLFDLLKPETKKPSLTERSPFTLLRRQGVFDRVR